MRLGCLLGVLLNLIACSTGKVTSGSLAGTAITCTQGQALPGMVCLNTSLTTTPSYNWAPLVAGECGSSTDCPAPYNHCCSNTDTLPECFTTGANPTLTPNICVAHAAAPTDGAIWFATDSIQPGVTQNYSTATPSNNDYVYNIMAKGYQSLDDWCMSQAQLSTISAVRNVSSWTALIAAQPDTSSVTGTPANRIKQIFLDIASGTRTVKGPNTGSFSSTLNTIYDKNGLNPNLGGGTWSAWTGFTRDFCPATVATQACSEYTTNCDDSCRGAYTTCTATCSAACLITGIAYLACAALCPVDCAYIETECACTSQASNCSYYGPYNTSPSPINTCAGASQQPVPLTPSSIVDEFSSEYQISEVLPSSACTSHSTISSAGWTSPLSSTTYGVLVLPPSTCVGAGFDFATDCGTGGPIVQSNLICPGIQPGSIYNANGGSAHSILCLANEVP